MAPVRMPRVLTHVRKTITAMAEQLLRGEAELAAADQVILAPIDGKKTPVYLANATATAAMVPVWITMNMVQPKRKPTAGRRLRAGRRTARRRGAWRRRVRRS